MIRRPPRATQSRSSAASDVYKRQARSLVAHRRSTHHHPHAPHAGRRQRHARSTPSGRSARATGPMSSRALVDPAMNLVTLVIVVAVLIGAVHGYRVGLGWVVLPLAGLVVGFLLGVRLAPLAMGLVSPPIAKLAVAVFATLLLASVGGAVGRFAARKLDLASDRLHLRPVSRTLGAGLEAAIVLVLAWLLASGLTNVETYGLGRQVQASPIIRTLNSCLLLYTSD